MCREASWALPGQETGVHFSLLHAIPNKCSKTDIGRTSDPIFKIKKDSVFNTENRVLFNLKVAEICLPFPILGCDYPLTE